MEHAHESPSVMTVPLILLAIGALVLGFLFHEQLLGADWKAFWGNSIQIGAANHVLHEMHSVPRWVALSPSVLGLAGIVVAYLLYWAAPSLPGQLARAFAPVYRFVYNKWYIDALYDAVITRPLLALARQFWQVGDATLIDGVPNGLASLTAGGSAQTVKLQTGSIAVYAFAMLIGVVALVSIFLLFR